jgi:hypothetical protein
VSFSKLLDFLAGATGRLIRPNGPADDKWHRPGGSSLIEINGKHITAQAAFYAGSVHFPENAPWLDELLAELFAFPGVKHDDQVDSISQALGFINRIEANRIRIRPVIGHY